MPAIRTRRAFAAIAIASAIACSGDPIVLCACSRVPAHTVLYGSVKAPSGEGVEGATVHLNVGPPDCQAVASASSAPTDAAGRYTAGVIATGGYAEQCVRLWALAPPGSGLRNSDTLQFSLPPHRAERRHRQRPPRHRPARPEAESVSQNFPYG
jgi:hypothetical protein